jgi:hypothetical protein
MRHARRTPAPCGRAALHKLAKLQVQAVFRYNEAPCDAEPSRAADLACAASHMPQPALHAVLEQLSANQVATDLVRTGANVVQLHDRAPERHGGYLCAHMESSSAHERMISAAQPCHGGSWRVSACVRRSPAQLPPPAPARPRAPACGRRSQRLQTHLGVAEQPPGGVVIDVAVAAQDLWRRARSQRRLERGPARHISTPACPPTHRPCVRRSKAL